MSKIKIRAGKTLAIVLMNLISFSFISDSQAKPAEVSPDFVQVGEASWYGPGFHGRKTANGERFNTNEMTAAHKTLPFNTLVRVTNLHNDQSVIVRINDRGPYIRGRIIDLSKAAKNEIGMGGLADVRLEIYNPEEEVEEEAEETLAPVNLFEQVFPPQSKIFVEWNPEIQIAGELSEEVVNGIFKGSMVKIKVLTPDVADATLKIYEQKPVESSVSYFDITNKVKFVTGYSIEVAVLDELNKSEKLITKLATEKFTNIFLEEMYEGSKVKMKILVGNYETPDDAKKDIVRILNTDPTLSANIVRIGG